MKYILKKDLPFAKAGEEVIISATCVYIMGDKKGGGELRETEIYLGSIPQLVGEGWIEEAKPREFYVGENNEGGMSVPNEDEGFVRVSGYWNKITKLIEVIE